jgi:hypothetical protein
VKFDFAGILGAPPQADNARTATVAMARERKERKRWVMAAKIIQPSSTAG